MSGVALAWAWGQDIPANEKYVLVAVGDAANDLGECFTGKRFLSTKTGLSPDAVRNNLKRLEEKKLIEREPRERTDGSRTTDLIRCLLDPLRESSRGGRAEPDTPTGQDPPRTEPTTSSSSGRSPEELAKALHATQATPEMIEDAERLLLARTKVGTKIVTGEEMVAAVAALAAFNAAQGASHGLGAYLVPMVGRIRERPTWGEDAHVRLVESAWRIRWWERNGRGRRATPKVIYGNTACFENVVQDAADEKKGDMAKVERRRGRYERTRSVEDD